MNKTEKMTNRSALLIAINAIGDSNPEAVAKLQNMVTQLDKKNAAPKKMTAQQEKNEALKEDITNFLQENEGVGFTVSDLIKAIPSLDGDSNQHVSALVRALVEGKVITKYSEKRRTYFKAIVEE